MGKGGGFYQQDGPGDFDRLQGAQLADAVPRVEPLRSGPNKPYTVLGRSYTPITGEQPFRQAGVASWYGRQFHGRQTSSGEAYDMYAMTAAHPTLPIPSYARVTNTANGRSVIVRINDRGPFLRERVIDLSYAAAYKLDYFNQGSASVTVERILPSDIRAGTWQRGTAMVAQANGPGPISPAFTTSDPIALAPASAPASALAPPEPAGGGDDPIAAFASPASGAGDALPAVRGPGVYMQLGAFRAQDGAESLARHLGGELDWLAASLRLESSGGWYRLQAGPYASRGEADVAATRVREALGMSPVIVERR